MVLIVTTICILSLLALPFFLMEHQRNRKKDKIFRLRAADECYGQTAKKRDLIPSCTGLMVSVLHSRVLGDNEQDNHIHLMIFTRLSISIMGKASWAGLSVLHH